MATLPAHTQYPSAPTQPASSRLDLPPTLRSASRARSDPPQLSSLTTRSSSASRIYTPEQHYAPLVSPVWPGATSVNPGFDTDLGPHSQTAYRAWRREARARALRAKGKRRSVESVGDAARPGGEDRDSGTVDGTRRASKGKDKAVAFVVGIASSGDEGDVEAEEGGDEAELLRRGESLFGHLLEGDGLVPREPSVDEIIRAQVRRAPYRVCCAAQLTRRVPADPAASAHCRPPGPRLVPPVRHRRLHLRKTDRLLSFVLDRWPFF